MSDEHDFELAVPFVVCATNGGPYDDEAFVAGVRYGRWAELLKLQPSEHAEYEPPELVPQLDLLAMDHGYTIEADPFSEDWAFVRMVRGTP